MMYAWYSEASVQAGFGSFIWLTDDGREVEVTCVERADSLGKVYKWPDKVYRGPVAEPVRMGKPVTAFRRYQ